MGLRDMWQARSPCSRPRPDPRDSPAQAPAALRRQLAAEAARVGWRQALLQVRDAAPALFKYIGDERAGDWRFLLSALPRGRALCLGGALSPVPLALAETCRQVIVAGPPDDIAFLRVRARQEARTNLVTVAWAGQARAGLPGGRFDLVAFLRPAPDARERPGARLSLAACARRVAPGGQLYLEWAHPALLLPPARAQRRLAGLGCAPSTCYWPKPTFQACEMLLPLGDRRVQRYYLDQVFFATSARRRLLRYGLRVLTGLGLFEWTLPGYMLVAARPAEGSGSRAGAD